MSPSFTGFTAGTVACRSAPLGVRLAVVLSPSLGEVQLLPEGRSFPVVFERRLFFIAELGFQVDHLAILQNQNSPLLHDVVTVKALEA